MRPVKPIGQCWVCSRCSINVGCSRSLGCTATEPRPPSSRSSLLPGFPRAVLLGLLRAPRSCCLGPPHAPFSRPGEPHVRFRPDESKFVHFGSHCVSGIQHGIGGTAGPPEMHEVGGNQGRPQTPPSPPSQSVILGKPRPGKGQQQQWSPLISRRAPGGRRVGWGNRHLPLPNPRPQGGSGCEGRAQAKLKLIVGNSSAGWNRSVAAGERRSARACECIPAGEGECFSLQGKLLATVSQELEGEGLGHPLPRFAACPSPREHPCGDTEHQPNSHLRSSPASPVGLVDTERATAQLCPRVHL